MSEDAPLLQHGASKRRPMLWTGMLIASASIALALLGVVLYLANKEKADVLGAVHCVTRGFWIRDRQCMWLAKDAFQ
jgi:zinc transporter ZupT